MQQLRRYKSPLQYEHNYVDETQGTGCSADTCDAMVNQVGFSTGHVKGKRLIGERRAHITREANRDNSSQRNLFP